MWKKSALILTLVVVGVGVVGMYLYGRALWAPVYQKLAGKRTVAEVVDAYGDAARERMRPYFQAADVSYPPAAVAFLALKDSAILEVWAETEQGPRFIHEYRIRALSGHSGPKLREGDRQVPEGLYRIEWMNPNSAYHLSMKLNYPNAFDLKHAAAEGRTQPGSNIFIHGKALSIGCLAMGDSAIEELFVLAADMGRENIRVAIAPRDPRADSLSTAVEPGWVVELYDELNRHFGRYRRGPG